MAELHDENGNKITLVKYIESKISDLKEYFEGQLESFKENVDLRITAIEKAISISAGMMDKRLDGMNEVRDQLKDQYAEFSEKIKNLIHRNEFQPVIDRILEDIRILRESKAALEGKADQKSVNNAQLLAVLGISLSIISIAITIIINVLARSP